MATSKYARLKNPCFIITDLILDWSDVALVAPINRVWEIDFTIWREISASTRTAGPFPPAIHLGNKLLVTLQINRKITVNYQL